MVDVRVLIFPLNMANKGYLVPAEGRIPPNPFLHRIFLDHNIIFYFKTTLKKIKKKISLVVITFETIM